MHTTEKMTNKIWLSVVSVGIVIAIILGVVALVNPNDTTANTIPTINQQVENINNTLPELEKVSTELKGYIDTLETTVDKLQTDLNATNTAIDALEAEVYSKVDTEKAVTLNQLKADKAELEDEIATTNKDYEADVAGLQKQLDAVNANIASLKTELEGKLSKSEQKVLGELNSLKTSIECQLATVNADIAALKTKDTELSAKISDLKTYVDGEITATEDWVNATFMTLTQHSAIEQELSDIQTSITTINSKIATIESDLKTKLDEINGSIGELDAELAAEITKVTEGYTAAIAAFKTGTEAAYTTAIANAITASETSMKTWVNDELQKVYGKITTLQEQVDALDSGEVTDAELATAVSQQQKALDDAVDELKADIASIIAGSSTINTAVAELNTELDAISDRLTNLEDRVTQLENKVDDMNKAYTISFLPTYSDGNAVMDYQTKTATINFLTSGLFIYNVEGLPDTCRIQAFLCYLSDPSDRTINDATMLEWKELEVVYANTICPTDHNNLPSGSGNVLQVYILGTEDLSDDFWSGNADAMLHICIKGKDNSGLPGMIVSDAIPLVPYGYNP